jgi:hypothetical protein
MRPCPARLGTFLKPRISQHGQSGTARSTEISGGDFRVQRSDLEDWPSRMTKPRINAISKSIVIRNGGPRCFAGRHRRGGRNVASSVSHGSAKSRRRFDTLSVAYFSSPKPRLPIMGFPLREPLAGCCGRSGSDSPCLFPGLSVVRNAGKATSQLDGRW